MNLDKMSLSESQHQVKQGAAFVQDQEGRSKGEENFIVQMVMRAKKEWETFHCQHPDIDEETFYEALRFCANQWVLQKGTRLCDLPAFEQAKKHLECEVQKRAVELETFFLMTTHTCQEAQSLGNHMAAQAQQRNIQACEAIREMSSKKVSYLARKVSQLRAPGQARDRAKEAEIRVEMMKEGIEAMKELGVTIVYENLKEKLKEYEKEIVEQLNYTEQLVQESQRQTDVSEYVMIFEDHRRILVNFIKETLPNNIETHYAQNTVGTIPSDWDTATQRASFAWDQLQTFGGFVGGIQEAIGEALAQAKAQTEQVKGTQQQVLKAKQALERNRKKYVYIDKYHEKEKNKIEDRKKQKNIDTISKKADKLLPAIEITKSKTKKCIDTFESIYTTFNQINAHQMKISQKYVKFAKSLDNVKNALERAANVAQHYAKDAKHAFDQRAWALTLPDEEAEAQKAQDQARRIMREEMEAYSSAKIFVDYAIRYAQEIASEYRQVEEQAKLAVQHFTTVLQSHLPFEKGILQSAITAVKQIVKTAMNVIEQEKNVREAARQTATALGTSADVNPDGLIVSEQEALSLVVSANNALIQYMASYRFFHKLATEIAKDHLQTCKEQLEASLELLNICLDEIKQEKENKDMQRQRAASVISQSKTHLLIDEQTGAITLKDGVTLFHLQDLADIEEVPLEKGPGQSRLLFKDGHTWSNWDVAHDLLYETAERRASIDLQVSDGMRLAMLSLPNGTQIKLTDIDLSKTELDPARAACGVTITLKQDGRKINLLAAASVMMGDLNQEALLALVDKSLDESINRISYALTTKNVNDIEDSFKWAKDDDRNRKYLDAYLLPSNELKERTENLIAWMANVTSDTDHVVHILHEYTHGVLKGETGKDEITMLTVLENILSNNMQHLKLKQRKECLKEISKGKSRDTIINCQLLGDPDDYSTATNLSPNGQEVLIEYERAKAWQLAEQWQDSSASRPSEKWTRYLVRLRRAILDEAPAYFRTQFLIHRINEAVENDHLEMGTEEEPGVTRLAKELARGVSAINERSHQEVNDYARAVNILTQRIAAGIQDAVKTADPSEIMSRMDFLAVVFDVIEYAEILVENALDPMIPTASARELVQQINTLTKGPGVVDQRELRGDSMPEDGR